MGMNAKLLMRAWMIVGLGAASLLSAGGCADAPDSTTAPTTAEAMGVDEILAASGEKMSAMSTVRFGMVDETETGAPFLGTDLKSMEAVVETPNNFRMAASVVAPAFGFVEAEIVKVGDKSLIKLFANAPWAPLTQPVPFDFEGLRMVFAQLSATIGEAEKTGSETLDGVGTVRVGGTVDSGALAPFLTSADPGHTVTLTLWVDETTFDLRQVRVAGRIYDEDGEGTTRLLTLDEINLPVDIQLPETASGS